MKCRMAGSLSAGRRKKRKGFNFKADRIEYEIKPFYEALFAIVIIQNS